MKKKTRKTMTFAVVLTQNRCQKCSTKKLKIEQYFSVPEKGDE